MPLILDGTKGGTFPSWTTAGRPTSPTAGQTGFNTTLSVLETYSGTAWVPNGGKVLLGTYTASGAAALNMTGWYSSAFDMYEVEFFDLLPSTDNVTLYMRVSTDNGSSYDSGTNYALTQEYHYTGGSAISAATTTDTGVNLGAAHSTAANHTCVGSMKLFNPGSTSLYKIITAKTVYYASSTFNAMLGMQTDTEWKNVAAYNAIRLVFSSGNITGTARIYGVGK